jgi:hypothetical protein
VHMRVHPLKAKARGRFLARLPFGADVFLQHARGFMPGLLPDLEFWHAVVEGRGSETGAKRVGAIAVEVADPGAPQCPLQYPRHRSRVQGGFLHVFPAVDLAEDRPAVVAIPLTRRIYPVCFQYIIQESASTLSCQLVEWALTSRHSRRE